MQRVENIEDCSTEIEFLANLHRGEHENLRTRRQYAKTRHEIITSPHVRAPSHTTHLFQKIDIQSRQRTVFSAKAIMYGGGGDELHASLLQDLLEGSRVVIGVTVSNYNRCDHAGVYVILL